MKRIVGVLLVICILLSSLTGCSAVNKTRILGKWQVEDVQLVQQDLVSLMFDMGTVNIEMVDFGVFEIKYRIDASMINVGLDDSIKYSVGGNTLKLEFDEAFYAEYGEVSFDEFEMSLEDDKLILSNESFGKFILSRTD